jgi:hypothetical protein
VRRAPVDDGRGGRAAGGTDADFDANGHADGDADRDPDGDADRDPDGDADRDPDGDADRDPDGHADRDPDGHADRDPDGHADADADSDGHADADADADGHADADTCRARRVHRRRSRCRLGRSDARARPYADREPRGVRPRHRARLPDVGRGHGDELRG